MTKRKTRKPVSATLTATSGEQKREAAIKRARSVYSAASGIGVLPPVTPEDLERQTKGAKRPQ